MQFLLCPGIVMLLCRLRRLFHFPWILIGRDSRLHVPEGIGLRKYPLEEILDIIRAVTLIHDGESLELAEDVDLMLYPLPLERNLIRKFDSI